MAQLTQGMYGTIFERQSTLFDIKCGQIRSGRDKRTHNSGWYNKAGQKLGWGDLATSDMVRIAHELEPEELFITLSEGMSSWETSYYGVSEEAPGVDYVAEHALYIIAPKHLYMVTDWETFGKKSRNEDGHTFLFLSQREAKQFIETGIPPVV